MKTKDLVYVGVIALFGFLLLRKKSLINLDQNQLPNGSVSSTDNIPNGGLSLGQNMDLPNLTPKPKDSLSTEDALNNGNVNPIIKDDARLLEIERLKAIEDARLVEVERLKAIQEEIARLKAIEDVRLKKIEDDWLAEIARLKAIEDVRLKKIEDYRLAEIERLKAIALNYDFPIVMPIPQQPTIYERPIDYSHPVYTSQGYPIYYPDTRLESGSIINEPFSITKPIPQSASVYEDESMYYGDPVLQTQGDPIYYPDIRTRSSSIILRPIYLSEML